jgi:phosphoribosylamine--glycine ligase
MFGGSFGGAGAQVVIEEFMHGEEASFFALTDGTAIVPFGSAQDHKRVGDGDTGPNTGGMGAYSPAPVLTPELQARVMAEIIEPTVRTMREEGNPYQGVLFAGLMLTAEGPKLIEYNARFGDPECQVLMMRLRDDLANIMWLCATGKLDELDKESPEFEAVYALTVVMAANGYPATPDKGGAIDLGGPHHEWVKIFHAGTARTGDDIIANGGRVLNVTATGKTLKEAVGRAYRAVDLIDWTDGFCRRDIGWRALARDV